MGRKSLSRKRKQLTSKARGWLNTLLLKLQHENLEQLTMDDLAKLAGKSKSTIYEYFESKEEILKTVCQLRIQALSKSISEIARQDLDTVDLYTQLVEVFAEGVAGISIAFLQSINRYYPEAWSIINEFTDSFVELLKTHYTKGISEGIFNVVSVDLLGHLDKLFVTQLVTNPAIFSDQQYTVSNLIRDYLNLRLMGLLKR
jgi:AcrR family transcriptional regulator